MKISSFSVNIVFIVLMLCGVVVVPKIAYSLFPSSLNNDLTISYTWTNVNPEIIESKVTSLIEGSLARVEGVSDISSKTSNGSGNISIKVDKKIDFDMVKLEISSILRRLKSKLPKGVFINPIRTNKNDSQTNSLLMSCLISGNGNINDIADFTKRKILPKIRAIGGIEEVKVYGGKRTQWIIKYDKTLLDNYNLDYDDLFFGISNSIINRNIGKVNISNRGKSFVVLKSEEKIKKSSIENINISNREGRLIKIKDLAQVYKDNIEPTHYYRINGLNLITVYIFVSKNVNRLNKSTELTDLLNGINNEISPDKSINIVYDSSDELRSKINTIAFRTILTIIILLIFVVITSWSLRYLIVVVLCLLANVLISFVLYYVFSIEINMYSMAGMTVSLGIIIDNVIVMSDHLKYHNNKKVFTAILAATLTSLGAVWIIFGMGDSVVENVKGFSAVIFVNLFVSLFIAYFFVPALVDKISIKKTSNNNTFRKRRRLTKFNLFYSRFIISLKKKRFVIFIVAILSFGIPVNLLPTEIEGKGKMIEMYNSIFGSDFYKSIKVYIDNSLGGSLRLFTENLSSPRYRNGREFKPIIRISIDSEHGTLIEDMNEGVKKIENFLLTYKDIKQFTTRIFSANSAFIYVEFKDDNIDSSIISKIKEEVFEFADVIGNINTSIYDNISNKPFSNQYIMEKHRNSIILLKGYNYKTLSIFCDSIKADLAEKMRVTDLSVGDNWEDDNNSGYKLKIDKLKLGKLGINIDKILHVINKELSTYNYPIYSFYKNKYHRYLLESSDKGKISMWDLLNKPFHFDDKTFCLSDFAKIVPIEESPNVIRKNQEYQKYVSYNYSGSQKIAKRVRDRILKKYKKILPIGFTIEDKSNSFFWHLSKESLMKILYILIALVLIYFICSILLESLKQALAIIVSIPISFIGTFLTFYLFNIEFSNGGYASFVLLSGLTVNAALYIVNEYNILIHSKQNNLKTYIKAFNYKIIPIFLTIISTILGFIPFVVGKNTDGFWFSLAAGTMGGLVFSIIALIVLLPICMPNIKKS